MLGNTVGRKHAGINLIHSSTTSQFNEKGEVDFKYIRPSQPDDKYQEEKNSLAKRD